MPSVGCKTLTPPDYERYELLHVADRLAAGYLVSHNNMSGFVELSLAREIQGVEGCRGK